MKKFTARTAAIILALILTASALASCANNNSNQTEQSTPSVVSDGTSAVTEAVTENPYDAKIDFSYVAEQIALSGYEGTLMLELLRRNSMFFYENYTPEQYFSRAGAAARRLREEVEAAASRLGTN